MNQEAFRNHLLKNNVKEEQAELFIDKLLKLEEFLQNEGEIIDSISEGKMMKYTEVLSGRESEDEILDLLRAIINYANYAKKYEYIIEVIDIVEGYNAMDNLHTRIAEHFDEEIRDEIFKDLTIPVLGEHPDVKPDFTKKIMKRMEEIIGVEKTVEILSPCLHGRPIEPIKKDREDFLKLNNIDEFLKIKKQEFIKRLEKHAEEGTLEYAQYVDDEVVNYVKNSQTITPGIREGDKIIVTKIPYQMQKFLSTEDERMKRYYSCYCAWVRGAIKKGDEKEISPNFCNCSAGFFKQYWDIIFDQPIKVEPIETPLTGALECKFAVSIPKEYQIG
ncbi:MAG: hypothetical protein HeimAB125_20060 [Candidatus Heimdallarchaeota archaeon AB_125]|nr:MAG: hypothetical protein HeimAB125_20060 [Candidatus Heimdallarchaeota archaeon AB_125]